jgi:hypothetical protein
MNPSSAMAFASSIPGMSFADFSTLNAIFDPAPQNTMAKIDNDSTTVDLPRIISLPPV